MARSNRKSYARTNNALYRALEEGRIIAERKHAARLAADAIAEHVDAGELDETTADPFEGLTEAEAFDAIYGPGAYDIEARDAQRESAWTPDLTDTYSVTPDEMPF